MDVAAWLRDLGLERYESLFRDHKIDWDVLPKLTSEDLKEIGVLPIGHRRRLLHAIATFSSNLPPSAAPAAAPGESAQVGERRQLTVMFCDLVGSTALASRLDPEDLREVIGAYQKCVADVIDRFDGFVAKYLGDGVLAYFGYPQAHEDDAERAVRASLAAVKEVRRVASAEALQVRIGLATGVAVVGDLIGSGAAQEQAVIGDTPNLAARLQALAGPDEILIPENTRRLVGSLFEYDDLGQVEIRGLATPVAAFRVVRESQPGSRFEALRTGETPLVGRAEELELLHRRWAQAKAGNGQVVLISADPGVGKSRLAEAFHQSLEGEPRTRLGYFSSPHHQDSAPVPVHRPIGTGGRFRARGHARGQARQIRGVACRQCANRGRRAVPGRAAIGAARWALPHARSDAATQKAEDVRGAVATARWSGPRPARADDL